MIKSKTLKDMKKWIWAMLSAISLTSAILTGVIAGFIKKYTIITSIVLILLIIILVMISTVKLLDEKFYILEETKLIAKKVEEEKLPEIRENTDKIRNLDNVIEKLKSIDEIVACISDIKTNIDSDIVDHIFLPSEKCAYVILVLKIDNIHYGNYRLSISSVNMDKLKFECELISNDTKFNQINFKEVNNNQSRSSINNINFCANKGLSIGILKISLVEIPNELTKINISLTEKLTNKVLIDDKEYIMNV